MILSVSRRTDIPNYYSEWFFNRIKEGFVYVRNPMNPHQVSRINLSPEVVDCIVLWTKNPEPMMGRLEEHSIRIVNFRNIGKKENEHLEEYFNSEIAPFLSPVIVGERQPFPFLKNKDIYAAAVLEKKSGKKKIGIIPCGSGVIPRLIEVGKNSGTYILSEELILHFAPQVFKEYSVKSKSLLRVTRNADIDADALYDEDLDYHQELYQEICRY